MRSPKTNQNNNSSLFVGDSALNEIKVLLEKCLAQHEKVATKIELMETRMEKLENKFPHWSLINKSMS